MKNLSTGTGLALLAGAIVAWPAIDRLVPAAGAAASPAGRRAEPGPLDPQSRKPSSGQNKSVDSETVAIVDTMVSSVTASDGEVVFVLQALTDGTLRAGRLSYRTAPAVTDHRRLNTEVPQSSGFSFSGWTSFR